MRPALVATLAVKAALVGLLVLAIVRPDLPQFEGKAMTGRALTYPVATIVVPLAWLAVSRRRGGRVAYPYAADILLVLPFLVDVAGNALDLYDTVDWWDDANHLVNWALLSGALASVLPRAGIRGATLVGLTVGFGAVTAILWELAEYFTFIRGGPEEATAYTDTLGDLALGTCGSLVAGVVAAALVRARAAPAAPGSSA